MHRNVLLEFPEKSGPVAVNSKRYFCFRCSAMPARMLKSWFEEFIVVLSTSASTRQEKVAPTGPGQIEHNLALNYELIFIHPSN